MSDPNSNAEQQGLIARLGNWLKKDQPVGGVPENHVASVRPRGPTTRADLDVLERQTRKARLGLVRKSEFEELRRTIGHSPIPKGSTFSLTSALIPNTSFLTRARQNTRLKIDSIEEQISRSWFNSGLHRGSAISGLATLQGTSSRPFKTSNQTEIKVELNGAMVTLALQPEVLNAATAYALGDFVSAEQVLIGLTKKPDSLENGQINWDMLFEFYLALDRQAEFENLSVDFAARFGISPPLWTDHWNRDLASGAAGNTPAADSPAENLPQPNLSNAPFEVASYLLTDDADALAAHFDRSDSTGLWEVDWSKLTEVNVDALPALLALYGRVLSGSGEVSFVGASQLVDVLRMQTKVPDLTLDVQKRLWHLLSMHLQLIGDSFQMDEVSFQYSLLFEEILPTAASISCRYLPETATPVTGQPDTNEPTEGADTKSQQSTEQSVETAITVSDSGFRVVDVKARVVAITGTLKGDISETLAVLPLPNESEPLVFECKGFARIDSQAAGHLLGFLRSKKCSSGTVKLRNLNRLIGIYLFSFGLPHNVKLSFATL